MLLRLLAWVLLCLISTQAAFSHAEDNPQPEPEAGPVQIAPAPKSTASPPVGSAVSTVNPVSLLMGLLFIVAMIIACVWLIKRVGGVPIMGNQNMKVVAALPVGPREKVVLVAVGEQQLLIGVAPGRVSMLQQLEQPIEISAAANGDFSEKLKQLLSPVSQQEQK